MTAYNVINPASMVAGLPEDVSVVLANFNAIASVLNGNIDDANIKVAAAIAASKLAGYPGAIGKVLAGDGTWKDVPKVTTSTLAGGPPVSPGDTDIWVATAIDNGNIATTAGIRWVFQYNASSGSAMKWECIGCSPVGQAGLNGAAIPGTSTWTTMLSFTVARTGEYVLRVGAYGLGGGVSTVRLGYGINGVVQGTFAGAATSAAGDFSFFEESNQFGITAGQIVNMMGWANVAPTMQTYWFKLIPVRVA